MRFKPECLLSFYKKGHKMYNFMARKLGLKEQSKIDFVGNGDLPDKFLAFIIDSNGTAQIMAIGNYNLEKIIMTDTFVQMRYSTRMLQKPIIVRKFEAIDTEGYMFLSSDVSKVYSPTCGRLVCKTHPKHGKTKKFAPIGKVYNELFCILPK